MQQSIFRVIVLALWALQTVAEPPAYGSSSDEFDINSISSYLDDDQTAAGVNSKGVYSYSNVYQGQNSNPDRYKTGSNPFSFGQKSPVSHVPSSSGTYNSPAASYNQAYSVSQASVADYNGAHGANSFGNYDPYNGNPVGLASFSSPAYSTFTASPLVAHGTNPVPYTAASLKPVSSPHSNSLPGYSGDSVYGSTSSAAYPTSVVGGSSSHIASGAYEGHHSHNIPSSLSNRPPYQFEKPIGSPQFVSNYKGGLSSYSSFDGGFSSKPSRHPGLYKGFSSSPPTYISSSSGPSAHVGSPLGYKSPYYSEYKGGPGIYYSPRPHSPYAGYKSPNSFESYPSTPYKFVSESPRYPRYPGKYSSSRPGYSGTKIGYSSRPPPYATGYKSYSSKPPTSSYAGLF